jgi:hypothetical protein
MNPTENAISSKIAAGSFEFSKHAVDQLMRRKILVHEVREALSKPEILEHYPNDKYGKWGSVCIFFQKNDNIMISRE